MSHLPEILVLHHSLIWSTWSRHVQVEVCWPWEHHMRARVCFQTSSENKKMSSTNTCMSIASTATRTSVSFRVMVVRSSCSASWRRFCTHISQETSRAVRTLHVIFNLHHWLWRGSSFSNIQAMDVLPSSPPWTPLKASGTPTLPEMHGKTPGYIDTPIWNVIVECWQSANNANIRCSVHSPHLRVGLVFCRRARVLRRVASRRVAISTSHLYDMSPNHVSEHLLSISDLYIASPLVAAL